MEYNIYCDESCHLVSNNSKYMLIGAVYCPKFKVKKINEYINHLKTNYNLSNKIELKWNKVDKKTEKLYLDIINYFFNNDDLKFRVIVIDKTKLNHKKYCILESLSELAAPRPFRQPKKLCAAAP